MNPSDQSIPDITEDVHRTLEQLGVREAAGLAALFDRLHQQLDQESDQLQAAATMVAVEQFRGRWLGRKQGIIRGITDNWVKFAPAELKREIGKGLNSLPELDVISFFNIPIVKQTFDPLQVAVED